MKLSKYIQRLKDLAGGEDPEVVIERRTSPGMFEWADADTIELERDHFGDWQFETGTGEKAVVIRVK